MKGKYCILHKDGELYSTDNIFWYRFFTNTPLPGDVEISEKQMGTKTDWHTITHKGKVICRI